MQLRTISSNMDKTLRLEIITPEATVYSEDVDMVTLPAVEGQLGIYPQHIRLMTQMVPGEMIVRKNGHDDLLAVGEGLIEITGDRVSVVTDMAVSCRQASMKPRLKKRASALPPACERNFLLKKSLLSMAL